MRRTPIKKLDRFRKKHPTLGRSPKGADFGYFEIGPVCVVSGGAGDDWEHVSVSCEDRCPTWGEMAKVKSLFWSDNETVLQFHPRRAEYINQIRKRVENRTWETKYRGRLVIHAGKSMKFLQP